MNKDEYLLRKQLIELRDILKYFDKASRCYKIGDKFCTRVENRLKRQNQ